MEPLVGAETTLCLPFSLSVKEEGNQNLKKDDYLV
jgi:hypothetical protein